MTNEEAQSAQDRLADITWYLKGYMEARSLEYDSCPFTQAHLNALRDARDALENSPRVVLREHPQTPGKGSVPF